MSAPDGVDVLAVARRAVGMALDLGATDAEAVVHDERRALTRFAGNEINQNVAEADTVVNLRFISGHRVGVASANRHDDASLRSLAGSAAAIARLQPEQPDLAPLPEPQPTPLVAAAWAARTAAADPAERADAAAAIIAAAEGVGAQASGYASTADERIAVANSKGVAVTEPRSRAQVLTVMLGPDGGTGYAEQVAVDIGHLDARASGQEAAERTAAMRHPQELPAGEYPVVLDGYAVMDITDWVGYLGFNSLAIQEGRSFFEPGRSIGSGRIDLYDDPTDPAGTPASFDYEGVPKRRLTLLEGGVCREAVHDSRTAARAGTSSTGHGLPAPNPWGPFPLHLSLAPGSTPRDALIGDLDRGLLVTRFHYTNVVQPKSVVITGMTKDGLFLVEDGAIKGPVRNLRFTQDYLAALAAVEDVSAERRTVEGLLGTAVVPSLRIGAFTFTGTTEH